MEKERRSAAVGNTCKQPIAGKGGGLCLAHARLCSRSNTREEIVHVGWPSGSAFSAALRLQRLTPCPAPTWTVQLAASAAGCRSTPSCRAAAQYRMGPCSAPEQHQEQRCQPRLTSTAAAESRGKPPALSQPSPGRSAGRCVRPPAPMPCKKSFRAAWACSISSGVGCSISSVLVLPLLLLLEAAKAAVCRRESRGRCHAWAAVAAAAAGRRWAAAGGGGGGACRSVAAAPLTAAMASECAAESGSRQCERARWLAGLGASGWTSRGPVRTRSAMLYFLGNVSDGTSKAACFPVALWGRPSGARAWAGSSSPSRPCRVHGQLSIIYSTSAGRAKAL